MSARLPILATLLLTALVVALKLWLAGQWDLLADEAYYTVWSEQLALGYYDQPPAIAWVIAAARTFADTDTAVRLPAILAGAVGALALWPHYGDRVVGLCWWIAAPPLAWLTGFVTPDAFLLASWSVAMSAAMIGGRAWLLVGVAVAAAIYSKYTAIILFPLLLIGTRSWRDRWAWSGVALTAVLVLPHVGWLIGNDFVSVRFQLTEGLLHARTPGLWGPPLLLAQQAGVLTPLLLIAVGIFWVRGGHRVGWWTSLPLAVFFLLASMGGPPEAHWLAPAWIGAGLGLSHARGRLLRLTWVGMGTAAFASLLLITHAQVGLFRLPIDPADRVREGRVLADVVGVWALPDGVGWREPGASTAKPVHTERYQEAALIHWYTGLPTQKHPGCGRPDQYDLWPNSSPPAVWMVRPARSGDTLCSDATHPVRTRDHILHGVDRWGRAVGHWDLFEVEK